MLSDPIIISASRRTDYPRFYIPSLIRQLRDNRFTWHNPYNGKEQELVLGENRRAVLVLWSKDYGAFLANARAFDGWPLFFHFTINGPPSILEPDVPSLDARLRQMHALVKRWGVRSVRWRFDPIAMWNVDGLRYTNLRQIEPIAQTVRAYGIRDVTISYMDRYRKIDRRSAASRAGIEFYYPDLEEQAVHFRQTARRLADLGFVVHTCCEVKLAEELPELRTGSCIDAVLLSEISNLQLSTKPDRGQRRAQGCNCHQSVDVGCYTHHRCPGQCLYCYARP